MILFNKDIFYVDCGTYINFIFCGSFEGLKNSQSKKKWRKMLLFEIFSLYTSVDLLFLF